MSDVFIPGNTNSQFWERLTQKNNFWSRIAPQQEEWMPVRSVVHSKDSFYLFYLILLCSSSRIIAERQTPRTGAQVLMSECPLNTRCVSRNFCDNNGMVTLTRHNDLNFEDDERGFIVRKYPGPGMTLTV